MTRSPSPSRPVPSPLETALRDVPHFAGRDRGDRFSIALRALLRAEGGFNDISQDRGGATNFGISLRFLRDEAAINPAVRGLFAPGPIDMEDVRALTLDQAAKIYHWCFWVPAKCDALRGGVDHAVFDVAVNAGLRTAGRMLQRAINRTATPSVAVIEDGAIGAMTVAAANRIHPPVLIAGLRQVTADRYRSLTIADPSQSVFLTGWLARAAKLGSV